MSTNTENQELSLAEKVLNLNLELRQAEEDRKVAAAMHKENIARIKAELKETLKDAHPVEEAANV